MKYQTKVGLSISWNIGKQLCGQQV